MITFLLYYATTTVITLAIVAIASKRLRTIDVLIAAVIGWLTWYVWLLVLLCGDMEHEIWRKP